MMVESNRAPEAAQPSILIVDDDAGAIQVLGRMLAGVGRLRFATRGEDALSLAREEVPDLVLLDEGMPGLSGFDVCRAMKADPVLVQVPVIFITSFGEPAFEVQALRLGAVDFILKPLVPEHVRARARARLRDAANLRRARSGSDVVWIPAAAPTRALIVDADANGAQMAHATLAPLVTSVQHVSRSADALRIMADESINLVLLDAQMPDIGGFEVLQRLRADPALRHIAVVFVGRRSDETSEARALDLGAADFIGKPFSPAVLEARVRGVLRLQRQSDAALRARRERWQRLGAQRVLDIVDELPAAIVCLDASARVALINAAACRLLGVVDEQVLGLPARQLLPQVDALLGAWAADPTSGQRRRLEKGLPGARAGALEVLLSQQGEGVDQVTTLLLFEATRPRGRST
jgi:DNA-binding response OmpR family regulator